jgi:hypothetical protein
MTCPVVQAIKTIRGGGLYTENNDENFIKIGGGDVEYACDDATYYINLRLMEVARFELVKPNLQKYEEKFVKMFAKYSGENRKYLYRQIIDDSQMRRLLYRQLMALFDSIAVLEKWILTQVMKQSKKGTSINVSIPDIFLLPCVFDDIYYDTDLLLGTMNKIIEYAQKINVNALLESPVEEKFETMEDEVPLKIDMADEIPVTKCGTLDEYKAATKKILDFEIETANYVRSVEAFQTRVMKYINRILNFINNIMISAR